MNKEYSSVDSRYFKSSELENKFPGSSVYLEIDKKLKPPSFKFSNNGELYYEENSFKSWLAFVKTQYLKP